MALARNTVVVVAVLFVAWSSDWSAEAFGVVNTNTIGASIRVLQRHNNNNNNNNRLVGSRSSSSTACAALPEGYQEFGNQAIRTAARECGMLLDDETSDNRLDIEWKAGSIIVTVHGEVSLSSVASSSEDDEEADNNNEEDSDEDPLGDTNEDGAERETEDEEEEEETEFSLTLLARTINRVLDDDGKGLAIAEVHSIEVTTPGVSDVLVPGTPQFEAFKGFEVIVEQLDPKKKKTAAGDNKKATKTIEGRLVERNDEFTIINIKGRMKKMKNETVLSVRLPKAKKEKGSR